MISMKEIMSIKLVQTFEIGGFFLQIADWFFHPRHKLIHIADKIQK